MDTMFSEMQAFYALTQPPGHAGGLPDANVRERDPGDAPGRVFGAGGLGIEPAAYLNGLAEAASEGSLLGMVSTFQKEGSIKRLDLESFLEYDLLPRLEEGAVLVLDNARSHHGGRIAEIVEAAGCSLLYLPPYSPDFNPIELAWACIKRVVRKLGPRDVASRLAAIQSAIVALPSKFGESWFRKTGVQY